MSKEKRKKKEKRNRGCLKRVPGGIIYTIGLLVIWGLPGQLWNPQPAIDGLKINTGDATCSNSGRSLTGAPNVLMVALRYLFYPRC